MYQLLNTMAGGDAQNQLVSQHRTLVAAVKANQRLQRRIKKSNGNSSYLPVRFLCDWQPVDADEYDNAVLAAEQ